MIKMSFETIVEEFDKKIKMICKLYLKNKFLSEIAVIVISSLLQFKKSIAISRLFCRTACNNGGK